MGLSKVSMAALCSALGFLLVTSSASAIVPGRNGRIVFVRARCTTSSCSWFVVSSSPGDTNERVLAGPYSDHAFDDHFIVNWSPDARRVIFMANGRIWEVNSNGEHLHSVFTPPAGSGVDDGPTFTPDGKHIVFTRCCPEGFGYSLWMINADGSGLRDITTEPVVNGDGPADTTPQVSPKGKRIVFNRCFPDQGCVVATVSIRGGKIKNLTDLALDSQQPNWAPDSKSIVFEMHSPNGAPNIALIRANGHDFRQLTFQQNGATFDPSFSPNGRRIIFSHYPSLGTLDLFTMRPDGTHRKRVTATRHAYELEPKWATAPDRS
jgi:Tol biopolymer transport system component